MARPPSYRPAENTLIVEACRPRRERLRRLAGELGRSPEALAKRGARVIASGIADTTDPGDPWNVILDTATAGCGLHVSTDDACLVSDDAIRRAALDAALTAECGR